MELLNSVNFRDKITESGDGGVKSNNINKFISEKIVSVQKS